MKKIFLMPVFVLVAVFALAQADSLQPAYKRFPTLPPMNLLLTDSSTHFIKDNFSKKTPVLIILFNPECEHCKKETEELLDSINRFKDIQIVMATMMPFDKMISFYNKFKLANYKNITVGQDIQYLLPVFYKI